MTTRTRTRKNTRAHAIIKMFNNRSDCNIHFTKYIYITFFYKNICTCQKKVVPLQCN